MVNFLIIASGYNCEGLDEKCAQSVMSQTYRNFRVVFIDDGSTDKTMRRFEDKFDDNPRVDLEAYPDNKGAAFRRFKAIRWYAKTPETVIVLLGLDDELMPNALERIAEEYEKGKWMTYGNWKSQQGKMLPKGFLHFDEQTHKNRDYRKVKYRSTAPNTFKRFLFDQLTEDDFKINGKWIDTTTESSLMFSCLEMCGKDRIGVIEDPIYLYNENLPGGTIKRLGSEYKLKTLVEIMSRPKKPLYEKD